MAAGSIIVELLARTGSFQTDMDRAAKATKKAGREMEDSATRASKAWTDAQRVFGAAFLGISAAAVFKSFIQNTIDFQNEQAQLSTVLVSTGRSASMSAEQLNRMGAAMSSASAFSTGEITQAQIALLAFTGVAGNEFPRAMQAAADMAARTGMSIQSASELIGRSLDVPSQGLTALSRQGFRFTDEQKALAKQLEDTGRTAEAQGIILDALEESYKGAAEAARNTLGGALISLKNTLGGLLTGGNEAFQPITDGINALNSALASGAAEAALTGIGNAAWVVATVLGGKLVIAAVASAASFTFATVEAIKYQLALAKMAGVSTSAAVGIGALTVAARAASAAFAFLTGPMGIVVTLAAGAAMAIYGYRDSLDSTAVAMGDAGLGVDRFGEKVDALKTKVTELRQEEAAWALQEITKKHKTAQEEVDKLGARVEHLQVQLSRYPGSQAVQQWNEELVTAQKEYVGATDKVEGYRRRISDLEGQLHAFKNGLVAAQVADSTLSEGFLKFEASVQRQIALMGKTGQAVQLRYDLEHGEMSKWSDEEKKRAVLEIDALDRAEKAEEARRKSTRGAGAQSNELQNLIKRLNDQKMVLGMTTEQAERYRITIMLGASADRDRALALHDEVVAFNTAAEAQKKYSDLLVSLYTEEEKSAAVLRERLGILDAVNVSAKKYADTAAKIAKAAFSEMPDIKGVTVEISGVSSELGMLEEQEAKLQEWYSKQLELLDEFRQERADLNDQWDAQEQANKEKYEEGLEKIERSRQAIKIAGTQEMFGSLSSMTKAFFGEQSGIYKTMFAMEKAYAIAKVLMNAPKTASDAYQAMAGIPVVGPALGVAAAAAAIGYQMTQVASIRSVGLTGMAHDGIDSVPKTGTWLLERGERVSTAKTSARLDSALDRIEPQLRSGRNDGGTQVAPPPIINIIEDASKAGKTEVVKNPDGNYSSSVFVRQIRSGGEEAQALEVTYGLTRVGR